MGSLKYLFQVLFFLLVSMELQAQSLPQLFNYQAVAREKGQVLANKNVQFRFEIIKNDTTKPVANLEYREVHNNIKTDATGLINLTIGSGNAEIGQFKNIDWTLNTYFLRVLFSPNNDGNFINMGFTQLKSVPFALVAQKTIEKPILTLDDLSDVAVNTPKTGDILKWNGAQWQVGQDLTGGTGSNYNAGNGINISGNIITNTGDLSNTNEIQTLNLNGNILSLSNGGGMVSLPTGGGTNYTAGNGINISGSTISAVDNSATNEIQTLSVNGNNLSLSNGGGTISLPNNGSGTTYSAGNGITINGSTISAVDNSATNEIQTLSINGANLSLSNGGGTVAVPGLALPYSNAITNIFGPVFTINGSASQCNIAALRSTTSTSSTDYAVQGISGEKGAILGKVTDAAINDWPGISGYASGGIGVYGSSTYHIGVKGVSSGVSGKCYGVYGYALSPGGIGGFFETVNGRFALETGEGDVGLGTGSITLSNQEKVTINGNISFLNQTKVPTISGTMGFANSNFYINNDIINNYDGDYYLGLSGSRWKGVYATNGTINTSDAREKENIHALNYGLSQVMQLKPVTFTWRKRREEGTKIGFVAQDLQTVLPEVVADKEWSKDENGNSISKDATRLGVYYSDIIPVLTKAIQEQQAMIEALQKEMAAMKKKMGE